MLAITLKNATFAVPVDILQEMRALVRQGKKPTVNSLVREALEEYLEKIKQEDLREEMLQASQDPLFQADVLDCAATYRHIDRDELPEW